MDKLKRVIIKEELVELTGDFKEAVVLNQFIYWQERVKDFRKFVEEENKRLEAHKEETVNIDTGWIYKSAEEMSEETLLGVSKQTMRRIMERLVEKGWLHKRNNPRYKWDHTNQYRVDIVKVANDLEEIGFHLDGYARFFNKIKESTEFQNGTSKFQDGTINDKNGTTIPEITYRDYKHTKTYAHSENASDSQKEVYKEKEKKNPKEYSEDFEKLWKQYPNKKDKRKAYLKYMNKLKQYSYEVIEKGMNNYVKECEEENRYFKHLTTFLNGDCFLEYQEEQDQKPKRTGTKKNNVKVTSFANIDY